MTVEHTVVTAADQGWGILAARLAPPGISNAQKQTWALQIAVANGLTFASVLHAGLVLHYDTDLIPQPATTYIPGARPFSPSSPWNTPTPAGTRWFDTPALHLPHGWINVETPGQRAAIRIWHTKPGDPLWTFQMPDYIAPAWHRNRKAATFTMHAPAGLYAGLDDDHVLVVVDGARYCEVWQARVNPTTRTVDGIPGYATGWATGDIAAGPGAGTATGDNDGVRAANFSWAAGLITGHDLAAGKIDHALVIALQGDQLNSTSGVYVPPATGWDPNGNGPIRMGSRIGIPAGTARPAGLSPFGSLMFDALQRYGAFVGDYCGGDKPQFYVDAATVQVGDVAPFFEYWDAPGGSADYEKIHPLWRVADYQP